MRLYDITRHLVKFNDILIGTKGYIRARNKYTKYISGVYFSEYLGTRFVWMIMQDPSEFEIPEKINSRFSGIPYVEYTDPFSGIGISSSISDKHVSETGDVEISIHTYTSEYYLHKMVVELEKMTSTGSTCFNITILPIVNESAFYAIREQISEHMKLFWTKSIPHLYMTYIWRVGDSIETNINDMKEYITRCYTK